MSLLRFVVKPLYTAASMPILVCLLGIGAAALHMLMDHS
jgi:hypothetical protein